MVRRSLDFGRRHIGSVRHDWNQALPMVEVDVTSGWIAPKKLKCPGASRPQKESREFSFVAVLIVPR